MGKTIINGNTARQKILNGIKKVENAVAKTFGPRGRLVAYYKGNSINTTKDGISVALQLNFTDELENMGAMLIKEAASKANFINGDGSSLTTILTGEMCQEFSKLLDFNADINQVKSGIKFAQQSVLDILDSFKVPCETSKDIYRVALVSANGDVEIATNISDAFKSIGENGIVSIGDSLSRTGKTSVVLTNGLEWDKGFASSLSVNTTNDTCELNDPDILIAGDAFNDYQDLAPILQQIQLRKKQALIISPSYDELVISGFNEMLREKRIEGACILAPGLSKQDILNRSTDIAKLVGATLLNEEVDIDRFDPDKHFGHCESVRITKNKITISGAKPSPDFDDYINKLKSQSNADSAEEALSQYEIDTIKERIAKISGGVATIRIGALNQMELGEKKDRYEDAINAVRSAMESGCVPGGSTPLLNISYNLLSKWNASMPPELNSLQKQQAAISYVKSLRVPGHLLIKSAGCDIESIVPQIINQRDNFGFDSRNGLVVDLVKIGIIDPYKVIKNSIIYATSVAEIFINIDLTISSDIKNMSIKPLDDVLDESGFQGV